MISPDTDYLRQLATQLHRLADDVLAAADGQLPSLADAPLLEDWKLSTRPVVMLEGAVSDHPLLVGDIGTSQIFCMDPSAGWARSFSRFYRLGAKAAP